MRPPACVNQPLQLPPLSTSGSGEMVVRTHNGCDLSALFSNARTDSRNVSRCSMGRNVSFSSRASTEKSAILHTSIDPLVGREIQRLQLRQRLQWQAPDCPGLRGKRESDRSCDRSCDESACSGVRSSANGAGGRTHVCCGNTNVNASFWRCDRAASDGARLMSSWEQL